MVSLEFDMSKVEINQVKDGDAHAGFELICPPESNRDQMARFQNLAHNMKLWPSGWLARSPKGEHFHANQKNRAEYNMAPTTVVMSLYDASPDARIQGPTLTKGELKEYAISKV